MNIRMNLDISASWWRLDTRGSVLILVTLQQPEDNSHNRISLGLYDSTQLVKHRDMHQTHR